MNNNAQPTTTPAVRGACPGALSPMESGDGWIVRIRPYAGTLTLDQLRKLAELSMRFGNGELNLTRRANVQIRGLRLEDMPAMQAALADANLLDANCQGEAVRNVLVSPLSGLDPTAKASDVRPLARELSDRLANDPALWALPTKFGFAIDDGGALSLDDARADLRIKAISSDAFALAVATASGLHWLGSVSRLSAVSKLTEAAAQLAALMIARKKRALRFLATIDINYALASLNLEPLEPVQQPSKVRAQRLGWLGCAVGIAVPFGNVSAKELRAFVERLTSFQLKEIRLSPWRAFYVPAMSDNAQSVITAAQELLWLTDDNAPIVNIDACPGAPACPCANIKTRETGLVLAEQWDKLDITSAHISGCTKGCARSTPADLVLVGDGETYNIIRGGRADAAPVGRISASLVGLKEAMRA